MARLWSGLEGFERGMLAIRSPGVAELIFIDPLERFCSGMPHSQDGGELLGTKGTDNGLLDLRQWPLTRKPNARRHLTWTRFSALAQSWGEIRSIESHSRRAVNECYVWAECQVATC